MLLLGSDPPTSAPITLYPSLLHSPLFTTTLCGNSLSRASLRSCVARQVRSSHTRLYEEVSFDKAQYQYSTGSKPSCTGLEGCRDPPPLPTRLCNPLEVVAYRLKNTGFWPATPLHSSFFALFPSSNPGTRRSSGGKRVGKGRFFAPVIAA